MDCERRLVCEEQEMVQSNQSPSSTTLTSIAVVVLILGTHLLLLEVLILDLDKLDHLGQSVVWCLLGGLSRSNVPTSELVENKIDNNRNFMR